MKKFRRLIIVCVLSTIFFFSGFQYSIAYENEIKDLSSVMTVNIANAGKKTVAVVDFTDLQGNVTELGRFLAEEFSVALAGSGKGFEVVDRTHLKSIITEHKLSATGLIDPQTARKLGKIAGVDALITGTITPFGYSIRLAVKVLDTETAKMISASSGNIARTKAIEELLARGIRIEPPTTGGTGRLAHLQTKAMQEVLFDDFIFKVDECKRSGGSVTFYLSIENNAEKERNLSIYAKETIFGTYITYLYDDKGNQHEVTLVKFGTKSSNNYSRVGQVLIPKVPVSASIKFENVSVQAMIGTLRLECYAEKHFPVVFRNIPLSK